MSAVFRLHNAGMRYGDRAVLREISLEFAPPSLTVIAGPNGAGKSTLLGILSGLREDYTGECFFDSTEVRKWHRRDFARRVSLVPQATRIEFPFSAEEVVLMGRAPHASGLFESSRDRAVAHEAMDLTETWHLRARDFRSLSGGEQQRVVLASALAQSPEALLLDEPTTYLDVRHQVALYRVMRTLSGRGVLVVAVTHDLNLAAAYAQRVILLSEGVVAADGPPEYAFHPERIRAVFGVPAELLHAPDGRAWLRYAD